MKEVIINESNPRIASDFILNKIYELEVSKKDKLSEKHHRLSNLFNLDNETIRIPCELFSKIIKELNEKGIIKSSGSFEQKMPDLSAEEREYLCFKSDSIEEFREFIDIVSFDFTVPKLSQLEEEMENIIRLEAQQEIKTNENDITIEMKTKSDPACQKNKPNEKEIKSILIVTPTFGNFNYLWVIINNDFSSKLQVSSKSKQNQNDDSFAMKLYRLADLGETKYDKSLWDEVNYALYKRKPFKNKFKKTTILKRLRDKIYIKEGYIIKKASLQQLPIEDQAYFPT